MGLGAKVLVRMETNSDHRGPGDRGALAQIGVRTLLACDLQGSTSDRQEEGFQRGTGSHLPYGGRESNLGSAAHPWGASHVGIRCFRENDLPLDAPSAERSRARQTLARLSAQSPRSYRCDGLLHSANDHVRRALLLLRHWA